MAPLLLLVFSVLSHVVTLHYAVEGRNDPGCPPYNCNERVGSIGFPFKSKTHSPECGFYTVDCSDPSRPRIQLKEEGYWYAFEDITQLNLVSINDDELRQRLKGDHSCSDTFLDMLSLPSSSPFTHVSTPNLTLFKCNSSNLDEGSYTKQCQNAQHTYYTAANSNLRISHPPQCSIIQLPAVRDQPSDDLSSLTAEFSVQVQVDPKCYKCFEKSGTCQNDEEEFKCANVKGNIRRLILKPGLGVLAGAVALVIIFRYFFWMKHHQNRQIDEAFLRNCGPLQVKRYKYTDVKKMTNSFKHKLGQGGYGGVYKGKMKDGCLVAVKVLNRTKGDGEEFMNEVAAISRTSHVNIVNLLGFCFEGSKRALVYEFMPNGSLEKFIFDANNPQKDRNLGWEALDRITVGIARGLEYLHRGCNTRILHFDIKPHNILLDENFSPKISDFGLAKICDRKESMVSMLVARGTVGYIAPEVFCKSFGAVSHKSDVYSYGMMLSEMVGGRRSINAQAENTNEIYFPHWIYKRLELDQELGLQSIMNQEDKERARKMIIVSMWCIQTDPSNRPSTKQVIEMLEGSVESLQIPPKPYLSSPPKSPAVADSSSTIISLE